MSRFSGLPPENQGASLLSSRGFLVEAVIAETSDREMVTGGVFGVLQLLMATVVLATYL